MKVTITFKHLDHTPSLDEKIKQKTEKLEKYLDENTTIHWTCSVHEDTHHADIHLTGPTFQFNASADGDNLYKSVEAAIHKIEKQLSRRKEKFKNKIHHKHDLVGAGEEYFPKKGAS